MSEAFYAYFSSIFHSFPLFSLFFTVFIEEILISCDGYFLLTSRAICFCIRSVLFKILLCFIFYLYSNW